MKPLNRETAQSQSNRPVKVLQFGTGNFLRGFVDWVIDILNEKTNFNGDVQIVQPHGRLPAETLNAQEGLYHVLVRGFQNGQVVEENRLITSVLGAVNLFLDYGKYLQLAENADLRFVISNTTEAGIYFDPNDSDREIIPGSFPAKLTALLYRRFTVFEGSKEKGLIIIPCELIENNGGKLKETILLYADLWNLPQEFSSWIEDHNTFCNTLVDRIVPGFPQENVEEIQNSLGFKDELMVMAEPFHLWVIEGPESLEEDFPAGNIGLEVKFVKDLSPYRERKVRILNGAHTALVPLAYLHGLRTVKEAVEDGHIGGFLQKIIQEEIIPTLDLPKEELNQFAHDVMERFKNPFIKHQLSAIALNSMAKFEVRVLPSLLEYVARKNQLPQNLVRSFAALIVFYKGHYKGQDTPIKDTEEVVNFFQEVWKKKDVGKVVDEVLSNKELWKTDLTTVLQLPERLADEINLLLEEDK
ncbi:MAG: tagaturonate reductase [Anditalea sp.]